MSVLWSSEVSPDFVPQWHCHARQSIARQLRSTALYRTAKPRHGAAKFGNAKAKRGVALQVRQRLGSVAPCIAAQWSCVEQYGADVSRNGIV